MTQPQPSKAGQFFIEIEHVQPGPKFYGAHMHPGQHPLLIYPFKIESYRIFRDTAMIHDFFLQQLL